MSRTIIFFCVLISFAAKAQQPLFTQYYVNDMILNPAISGSKTYNSFIIQTRQQWLGFPGAPLTTNISYHGALNNRSAMGGYLMFDKAYPSTQGSLHLNYAYHIPLDYERVYFSFGLGAKLMYYNLDFNEGELPPEQDNAFSTNSYNKLLGDASSGVYLYGRNFHLGYSVTNLLQSSFKTPVNKSFPNLKLRNYYGMGAYRFEIINNDWQLEPSFLVRKMENRPTVLDFSTRIFYFENTWGGFTYRNNGTLVFCFGFGSGSTHFSYSYDHTFTGDIEQYTLGTHEIGISFRIKNWARQTYGF